VLSLLPTVLKALLMLLATVSYAGGSRQGNERNHQGVFDEILPVLVLNQSIFQALHLDAHFEGFSRKQLFSPPSALVTVLCGRKQAMHLGL
jgi:hypothetical protein